MDAVIKGKAKAETEPFKRPSRDEAEDAVRTLIAWAGDDPKREGLIDTPGRVVDWWAGESANQAANVGGATGSTGNPTRL